MDFPNIPQLLKSLHEVAQFIYSRATAELRQFRSEQKRKLDIEITEEIQTTATRKWRGETTGKIPTRTTKKSPNFTE